MPGTSARDWFIPVSCGGMTLREANATLDAVRASQEDIPMLVRMVENPAYDVPLLAVFHGATDLQTHDYLHIVLGRGLLPKDEAFVIGFTMGSTDRVSASEEFLYGVFAKYFYPRSYRFSDEDLRVFRDAVRLGFVSDCCSLAEADYEGLLDRTLDEVRAALGVEKPLLDAYYAIEKRRYPQSAESQRLLA
jgi:hypothetical protein